MYAPDEINNRSDTAWGVSMNIHSNSGIRESTASDEAVLMVENLTKQFGGLTAVDHLSFTVREGEILGFIGPNGAGKSTTFDCITGALKPTEGTVKYHGEDITGRPTHELIRKGVARTYQDFRPLKDRNVIENIELALYPNKLWSFDRLTGKVQERAAEIAERVGLDDRLDQTPEELPHASMLRVELGRALATDPDLLLIDEPFAGLSTIEVEDVSELLLELREEGITIIVIDHNMRGLLDLVDRTIVINFGSKIAEGTPDEITNNPKVQEAYLGGS
jgi:branched-chain amino acid transport system ATP-binding protein